MHQVDELDLSCLEPRQVLVARSWDSGWTVVKVVDCLVNACSSLLHESHVAILFDVGLQRDQLPNQERVTFLVHASRKRESSFGTNLNGTLVKNEVEVEEEVCGRAMYIPEGRKHRPRH